MPIFALLSVCALLPAAAFQPMFPDQAGQASSPGNPEQSKESPADAPLEPHAVARINGTVISANTYYHYLSLVYARMPEGDLSLEQLMLEEVLQSRAGEAGVSVDESEVDAVFMELDARARAATNGEQGLLDSVGGPEKAEALRTSVRLAALHRKVVAHEQGVASAEDVDDSMLQAWLDEALACADIQEAPLDEAVAARWSGGSLSRVTVGARIARLLSPTDQTGLLTELLGIHMIRQRAAEMGVVLTPEAAADELLERERQVAANPSVAGVTYADIVQEVFHRDILELVASPKFGAEVLLSLIVNRTWNDARLVQLFEAERSLFEERLGGTVTFVQARFAILKEVRQRTYRQLLESSTIIRRF